jgi:hypothetical protein
MAKKSEGFNLSATIREFRKSHRGVPATAALAAVKKAHPNQKINDGTFKATFYKLAGGGKKKSVRRRKPGSVVPGHGSPDHIMKAASISSWRRAASKRLENGSSVWKN